METEDLVFPEDLYYDEHHQWIAVDGDRVTIGLTDYAQKIAGDIVFIDLPRPGRRVEKGQAFGSLESGKWVGRLYSPLSGTVLEVNDELARRPRTMNEDPYGRGWIARLQAQNPSERGYLLRADAARARAEAELERERLIEAGAEGEDGEP